MNHIFFPLKTHENHSETIRQSTQILMILCHYLAATNENKEVFCQSACPSVVAAALVGYTEKTQPKKICIYLHYGT